MLSLYYQGGKGVSECVGDLDKATGRRELGTFDSDKSTLQSDPDLGISGIPGTGNSEQDFSTSVLTFWAELFFVAELGGCLVHCGKFSGSLGLPPNPSHDNRKCLQT